MFLIENIKTVNQYEYRIDAALEVNPSLKFEGLIQFDPTTNKVAVDINPAREANTLQEAVELGNFCGRQETLVAFRNDFVAALKNQK